MTPLSWAFLLDSVPFTRKVIDGETSLGGSESACLGLARALKRKGHQVHIFTTQLAADGEGPDATGLQWHHADDLWTMSAFIEWDVVCALRMYSAFAFRPVQARMKVLWNQDLLVPGQMQNAIMGMAWGVDHLAYVSEYHRQQWEDLEPELKAIGWVTRNGFDAAHVATSSTKNPNRIIHISRPERGLGPILQMWPALRAQKPDAELFLCRYSSMYDQGPGSWSDTCASYDNAVKTINEQVGGITYLGELNKAQLYKEIATAAVMWYPGVSTFAETSCIAAIEAQACGTPFVGARLGALPETAKPSDEAGLLITGKMESDKDAQQASIDAVLRMLDGCKAHSREYREIVQAGYKHTATYGYDTIAGEWETQVGEWFAERYDATPIRVMEQLLHEDDHTAALICARDIITEATTELDALAQAEKAAAFCQYVIDGKDQVADDYAAHALVDPLKEAQFSDRFAAVVPVFEGRGNVLDVACGNGAFAIALALKHPTIHVYGLDYAQGNIDKAKDGAIRAGVADRCTFKRVTVYDFENHRLHDEWEDWKDLNGQYFDGLFVGEFIEHTWNYRAVIDGLEAVLDNGAQVVYTCPRGNCAELVPRGMPLRRGHVHNFHHDDLNAVFGPKLGFAADYLASGITERGNPLGNWLIGYQTAPNRPAGSRPLHDRIVKTRPLQKLTVGLIVKDAENDLGRCLSSVYKIADELIVGDTGSTDTTVKIAQSYGAKVLSLAPIDQQPEGFAGARNQVLHAATGDWFLWIDADEDLQLPHLLRRYIEGEVFEGYVIPQTHLYLDGPPTFDIPVRLFRNTGAVRFYGCVHEQPQDGDANTDIFPTLQVADLKIVHLGYLTQDVREEKRVSRNLPLLIKDQKVFADRKLGKVLLLREAVIQSDMLAARNGGQMTPRARVGYLHAVQMYIEHFDEPGDKFGTIVRPWYEAALRHLGMGWEVEFAMAGRAGGLEARHAKPERLWVRDANEYARLLTYRVEEAAKRMVPVTFHTEPFPQQEAVTA